MPLPEILSAGFLRVRIVFTMNYLCICTSLLSPAVCKLHNYTWHEKGYYYVYSKHSVSIFYLVSFLVLCCQKLWANIPYSPFWIFNDFMFIFHIPSLIILIMILSTFFLVLRYPFREEVIRTTNYIQDRIKLYHR